MEYEYYVVYQHESKVAALSVKIDASISCGKDVANLAKTIKDNLKLEGSLVITNFIHLNPFTLTNKKQ